MRDPRNPFRLRQSESIESDVVFLNLFEPGILDILESDTWYKNVRPIRSAAGGGKTSLLRLFTPNVLQTLHSRKTDDRLTDLYSRLRELGAFTDSGPQVLGVMLLCGRNYALLQDLDIDNARKTRLFFSLLNFRILLAILRAAMTFRQLRYPKDLDRLQVAPFNNVNVPHGISLPCTGKQLYDWAADQEAKVCSALDSFGPLRGVSLPGHDTLFSLPLMRPEAITIDGTPVAEHTLLMLDDIHKLTSAQRQTLIETVIELRSPVGVWIAERFEALSTEEMLAQGATEGREYQEPIALEPYWRRYHRRFERHAVKIADRRIREATATEVYGFRPCLQESLDCSKWEKRLREAANIVRLRVEQHPQASGSFREWIEFTKGKQGSPQETLVAWRSLEILIERQRSRRQKTLFEHEASPTEELDRQCDNSLMEAAELFLAREFSFPYYFGIDRVCRLASVNIQQFLGIAGDVFEDVLSAPLAEELPDLSAERQHALIKSAATVMWNEIPNRVRHGRQLRRFLESVCRFAQWYTYRPTAPNDPGVTGTAIRMAERERLTDSKHLERHSELQRLADVIASALAHNLFIADLDYHCKGERWMVLYLNRLLCVHFDLPIGYGLYKERPMKVLAQWLDREFAPPGNQESLL